MDVSSAKKKQPSQPIGSLSTEGPGRKEEKGRKVYLPPLARLAFGLSYASVRRVVFLFLFLLGRELLGHGLLGLVRVDPVATCCVQ